MEETTAPPPAADPLADLVATLIDEIRTLAAAPPRVERIAFSVDEVAFAIGRTRRVVQGLIDSGHLQAGMIGRQLAIPRCELERLQKRLAKSK